ncbi:helix-turn-helix transcriptional regulator [Nitrospirillum iridis]|uniref:DNA-binding CsgD family transcriptional regulator/PAS domain-containing protein n=1 Tax=Nitrospirillum iridis TaxID=765888 RepID=A0A7X0EFE0_9PROT|nr:helix-turn-helix transcriptional regulator [Nitrospirillum iridis]MBB6254922.1 DNA-binding CsgD family transcriptional regulator/PAS domain-containing protein [Nitrospirillum iridis]
MQELLLGIYACSSAPERWPAALDLLCRHLSVVSAVVQMLDYSGGRLHPIWTVRDSYSTAHRHEHDRVFNNDSNPRLRIGGGDSPPAHAAITRDEEIFAPDSAELTEIQRRRRALHLGANLTGVIELAPGRVLALVLHRSAEADRPMGAEEEVLAAQLLPHLRQAVELGGQLRTAALKADLLMDAGEMLGAGMALCEDTGRLLWANSSARAILEESPAIRQIAGHVRAVQPSDGPPFRTLLARAAETLDHPLHVTLGRTTGDAIVQVLAMGARQPPTLAPRDARRTVALLLCEPGRPLNVSPVMVADLFGMSTAEARLTAGLCNGLSLGEYARQRGISEGTARIQLKRALAKTGCPRQAELVRRVCASLAVSLTRGYTGMTAPAASPSSTLPS